MESEKTSKLKKIIKALTAEIVKDSRHASKENVKPILMFDAHIPAFKMEGDTLNTKLARFDIMLWSTKDYEIQTITIMDHIW